METSRSRERGDVRRERGEKERETKREIGRGRSREEKCEGD
jgi:hypothetical protein